MRFLQHMICFWTNPSKMHTYARGRHLGGSWDVFVWQILNTNLHEFFVKASWYSKDLIGISGQLLGIHGAPWYALEFHAI